MIVPVSYPVNDTTRSADERAYLQRLTDSAAQQDLTQDLRPDVRNLSIGFTALAVVVVGLRFLARHRQNARYLTDDWLILFSLLILGGNCIMNMMLIEQGVGLHSGRLTDVELETLNQTILGAEIIYVTGVNIYKIALLFLYYRIFPLPVIKRWGLICGGISTAWNIACVLAAIFQCTPVYRLWNPWVDGYCIDLFLAQLCISIPSILCDIAILAFPLPHIVRLRTNLTQKICLVVIFLLGSYVVFTSIYRFKVFTEYSNDDIPFTLAIPVAWNVIEISSGIVSSCLPTLGPIVRPIIKSVIPSTLVLSGPSGYGNHHGPSGRSHGRAGSTPALVTIGSAPGRPGNKSKAAWDIGIDDFNHPPRVHHHHYTTTTKNNSSSSSSIVFATSDDIEMGRPHTVITSGGGNVQRSGTGDSSRRYSGSGGAHTPPQAGRPRGSDEWPLTIYCNNSNRGISKTVKVEWKVEEQPR